MITLHLTVAGCSDVTFLCDICGDSFRSAGMIKYNYVDSITVNCHLHVCYCHVRSSFTKLYFSSDSLVYLLKHVHGFELSIVTTCLMSLAVRILNSTYDHAAVSIILK